MMKPLTKKSLLYSGSFDAICGIFNIDHNDIGYKAVSGSKFGS